MSSRKRSVWGVLFLFGLAVLLSSCGDEGPVSSAPEDGRITLENNTPSAVSVRYTQGDMGEVEILVNAREAKDIFPVALEGGSELTIEAQAVGGTQPKANIPIVIDGDVTIHILSFGLPGENLLEYRVTRVRTGTGGSGPERTFREGRIFVENKLAYDMDVNIMYDDAETGLTHSVDTKVKAGAKEDVSQGVVTGGTVVTVKLLVKPPTEGMPWARGEAEVTVDGNITVRANAIGETGVWGNINYMIL